MVRSLYSWFRCRIKIIHCDISCVVALETECGEACQVEHEGLIRCGRCGNTLVVPTERTPKKRISFFKSKYILLVNIVQCM